MTEVKVLICGEVSIHGRTGSTITLVKDKNIVMITDPGTLASPNLLIKALEKEGISPDDVNIVFITHGHMDHYRNIGLFPNAKALDYRGVREGDQWKKSNGRVSKDIVIIPTPGHSYDSVSLMIKTEKGIVCICGDVFRKENYPKKDQFADHPEKLMESRKKILSIADYIIPGHGKMFKVEKG